MTRFLALPKTDRPLWQILWAPMLLASLGLHGLLLLLPASSEDVVIPPPDPEQDSVAITRIPPAGSPDAAATATAPLAAVAPRANAVPQPVAAQPNSAPGRPPSVTQPRPAAARPAPSGSRPAPAANGAAAAPTPPAATPPPPPPSAPATSRPLFDAAMGERLLAYVASLNLPQDQVDRATESIQNRFGFNAAAVTRDALSTNQRQWEAEIRQETGIADLTPELDRTSFSTVYPQRVCLTEDPGEVRIGALVNPDGTWRGEPTLLRSSGYGALDRKALQEIKTHEFAPGDGIRAQVLTVSTSVSYGTRPCLDPNPQS